MLTTIGEVKNPTNSTENIVMIINFLVAIVVVATLVGNIGSVISNMNIEENRFQSRVDAIKSLMKLRKVSNDLDKRVIRWFDYLRKNNQTLEESQILANLPDKLGLEIASHIHYETLKSVNIFSDCEEGLLKELVTKLRVQVYSPGDYVCRKGDIGKEMYVIRKGWLNVVGDDGKTVFVTLKEGAFFGEISILNIPGNRNGNRRTANIRSVGYSDLLCLNKNDLWKALEDYPVNKVMLIEKGKAKLRKDNLLDDEDTERKGSENATDLNIVNLELIENKQDEAFTRKTPFEKIEFIELFYENLEQKFDTIISEFKENCELINQRVEHIKNIYNSRKAS
jgi:cyclic nucleotide gated channel alpha 3